MWPKRHHNYLEADTACSLLHELISNKKVFYKELKWYALMLGKAVVLG